MKVIFCVFCFVIFTLLHHEVQAEAEIYSLIPGDGNCEPGRIYRKSCNTCQCTEEGTIGSCTESACIGKRKAEPLKMPQQKPTGPLLKQLRLLMTDLHYVNAPLNAYIVPSGDAHNSEYPAAHDLRRSFISGFMGSVGTAIVTHEHACLWTDGRYYLQALEEMDSNWTLMKEGVSTTPTQGTWLSKNLPPSSNVGVDPTLMTTNTWQSLQTQLEASNHKLIPVAINLIDHIWKDQPAVTYNPVKPLSLHFSGKPIHQKLLEVRQQMTEKNTTILVLTALDEIAWLLNLRGSDIEFNPVFFSYIVILPDSLILLINPTQGTKEVEEHLANEGGKLNIRIEPYEQMSEVLRRAIEETEGNVWLSDAASYALTSIVPTKRLRTELTPVAVMKAIKNPVEIKGMENAHIKDAAALCCFFAWLEKEVALNETVTEMSASKKLTAFRALQADFIGPSFETISSVGPHGAIIHYKPSEATDSEINMKSLYLCDSGGQYKDGTTDVTRTVHFGTPTDYERECNTRVFKGQTQLALSVFPAKIKGNCLDSFARKYLWDVGLDYAHGTGHGIGSYLNVHEGPMGISWRPQPDDPGLEAGMFLSNEPGYYEDGKFGIRIEDIVQIVHANPPHNFNNRGYLTFDTITLVPKQIKLLKVDMLTGDEIAHLNAYHQKCRDIVLPLLEKQGQTDAIKWLVRETEPISLPEGGTQ